MKRLLFPTFLALLILPSMVSWFYGWFFSVEQNGTIDRVSTLIDDLLISKPYLWEKIETIVTNAYKMAPVWSKERDMLLEIRQSTRFTNSLPYKWYAISTDHTPVFLTSNISKQFGWWSGPGGLNLATNGQIADLDWTALPWTVFRILGTTTDDAGNMIYEVYSRESYNVLPKWQSYYIDARFVTYSATKPTERAPVSRSADEIIAKMYEAEWTIYVRWGNNYKWFNELKDIYQPQWPLADRYDQKWRLNGVDCSGLVYEASDGILPRNTSQQITHGYSVPIKWKSVEEIKSLVQPLDLIVWKGHVIIVVDSETTIESRWDYDLSTSRPEWWTRVRPLDEVLRETMSYRVPVNDYINDTAPAGKEKFVIKRWFE